MFFFLRALPRFAIGNIRLLLFFFVGFKSMPIFILVFIAVTQTADGCDSLSESWITRGNACLLGEYIVSRVSFNEIIAVQICYFVLTTCSIQLISWSPLANRFSKRVPGPQNWYSGTCSSNESVFIAWFNKPLDIRCNSLSKTPDRYALIRQIIMLQVSTDRCTSESARICSDNLSYNRSMQFSNSRSNNFRYFSSFNIKLCRSFDEEHFDYWSILLYAAL